VSKKSPIRLLKITRNFAALDVAFKLFRERCDHSLFLCQAIFYLLDHLRAYCHNTAGLHYIWICSCGLCPAHHYSAGKITKRVFRRPLSIILSILCNYRSPFYICYVKHYAAFSVGAWSDILACLVVDNIQQYY